MIVTEEEVGREEEDEEEGREWDTTGEREGGVIGRNASNDCAD